METVGVEPTPPRCKRGALPPDIPKARTSGVEPLQPEAPGLQPGELAGAQRPHNEGWLIGFEPMLRGSRPRVLPLHHSHHGRERPDSNRQPLA